MSHFNNSVVSVKNVLNTWMETEKEQIIVEEPQHSQFEASI